MIEWRTNEPPKDGTPILVIEGGVVHCVNWGKGEEGEAWLVNDQWDHTLMTEPAYWAELNLPEGVNTG